MASGDKYYIADKATLDEVKGKIGSTTDTGGSSTAGSVFGKLNYLVSQVSSYLSSVYNNCLKIGTATDAGGSTTAGTIMAKLNDVITKNGKLADSNGGFLTVISSLESTIIEEITRSEIIPQGAPQYIKVDASSIYYVDNIQYKVIKLNKSTFNKINETPAQSGTISNLIVDETSVYITDSTAKKIIRFSKTDMTKIGEFSYANTFIPSNGLVVDSTSVYFWNLSERKVIKLNKLTLVRNGESQLLEAETTCTAISVDNNSIYMSLYNSTSGIYFGYKLNKSSLTLEYTFPNNGLHYFYMDDSYIYDRLSSNGIRKIEKTNHSAVSQFIYSSLGGEMTGDDDYIYIASGSQAIKLRKDTMTLSAITNTAGSSYVEVDENFLYRTNTTEKVIMKYDKIATVSKYQINGYMK